MIFSKFPVLPNLPKNIKSTRFVWVFMLLQFWDKLYITLVLPYLRTSLPLAADDDKSNSLLPRTVTRTTSITVGVKSFITLSTTSWTVSPPEKSKFLKKLYGIANYIKCFLSTHVLTYRKKLKGKQYRIESTKTHKNYIKIWNNLYKVVKPLPIQFVEIWNYVLCK